jgi:hypothetical protein
MRANSDTTGWETSQFPPFPDWVAKLDRPGLIYKQDDFTFRIRDDIEVLPSRPLYGPTLSIGPPFLPIIPYWHKRSSDINNFPIIIYIEFSNQQDSAYLDLSELEIITNSHGTFNADGFNRSLDSTEYVYGVDTIKFGLNKDETYKYVKKSVCFSSSPKVKFLSPPKYFEILFSLTSGIVADSINSFKIVFPKVYTKSKSYNIPSLEFVKRSKYKYYALYME